MFLYPVGQAYRSIRTDCYPFPLMHILPSFHLFMCTSYRPVLQIRPTLSNFFEIYSTLSQKLTIGTTCCTFFLIKNSFPHSNSSENRTLLLCYYPFLLGCKFTKIIWIMQIIMIFYTSKTHHNRGCSQPHRNRYQSTLNKHFLKKTPVLPTIFQEAPTIHNMDDSE